MKIGISEGVGVGPTQLSAFDQALVNAGVANFNLIYLSSVLPPGSKVVSLKAGETPAGTWGDRLYVVMAQQRTSTRNKGAWAGIGWMQDKKTRQGLLVEHEGSSKEEVTSSINASLGALAKNRGMEFGPIHMKVTGATCTDLPICALVVAVFESAPWRTQTVINKARAFSSRNLSRH